MKFFVCAFVLMACIAGIHSGGGDPFAACDLDMDAGEVCLERMVKVTGPGVYFYYNKKLGYCETFSYLGCGGNNNRFPNATFCETFCITMGNERPDGPPSGFTIQTNEPIDYE